MNIPNMTKEQEGELKTKAKLAKPLVWVGKNGITDEIIEQTKTFLKKRKLVKIKLLNSYVEEHDKKVAAMELALKTESHLVDFTGFMITLYKR
jgi:RNA-binding protein